MDAMRDLVVSGLRSGIHSNLGPEWKGCDRTGESRLKSRMWLPKVRGVFGRWW